MKIEVIQDSTVYVPDFFWFSRGFHKSTQITDWKPEWADAEETEPLTDFDLEDMSGATEQEFGR